MEPLRVDFVSFYPEQNAEEHHTSDYDLVSSVTPATPVFRRGGDFYFNVRFDRSYILGTDIVNVSFGFGPKPNPARGTLVYLAARPENTEFPEDYLHKWSLRFVRDVSENEDLQLQVHVPPHVPVGIWQCTIMTQIDGDRTTRTAHNCEQEIYILFNPWCPEDSVYMENEEERQEYLLNESGKIWCGTFKKPKGRRWIFGQFDDVVLPAAVFLVEMSRLPHCDRGSPVLITRAISAMINSVDDNGVIEGRWDGDYADGKSPHTWTGSTLIMDHYLRSGGKPVKYGQCWVFSAVVVTICRALGIPCRSVTNYVSAHDTDGSLTIDKYFDKFGNKLERGPTGESTDSCWNFHVWNDVWMARPDLPPGYGGWQIIDATPQEMSEARFQCGPASVEAVRKGEVCYMYDSPFVFAEVNADICHFQEDDDSDWGFVKLSVNKYQVGRSIVTKRIDVDDDDGDSDLWDVTFLYKNPEGSEAERLAVYNAIRGNVFTPPIYDIDSNAPADVEFDLVDIDAIPLGDSFDIIVNIINNSSEIRNISAVLTADSVYYNGVKKDFIKREQGTFTVRPGEQEQLVTSVTPEEYMHKLSDHSLIKIYAIANVQETKQTWSEEDDFSFFKLQLVINVEGEPVVGEEFAVNFRFQNPLSIPLTGCSYTIEGPGIHKQKTLDYPDVEPNGEVFFTEVFRVKRPGSKRVVATFTSNEIEGVNGSTRIAVSE